MSHCIHLDIAENAFLDQSPEVKAKALEIGEYVLSQFNKAGEGLELTVCFSNNDEVQKLNAEFRQKDEPTNVLSFPSGDDAPNEDGRVYVGDIILAYEVLLDEANNQSKKFIDHMSHLVVHGILHLLGYDHMEDEEAEEMEALEIEILQQFGIANPYIILDQ